MPTKEEVKLLHDFVKLCENDPSILHRPELKFYKEWLESLGATIPLVSNEDDSSKTQAKMESTADVNLNEEEEEEPESDLDIDDSGVIKDEPKEELPMGDEEKEITEEDIEKSNEKRSAAAAAFEEGTGGLRLQLWQLNLCFMIWRFDFDPIVAAVMNLLIHDAMP
ncbi:unnamed protein product [Soboliphyme baturini]|uniref:HipN domain-containing protein n=1 Tax=Soboliphyme baturini TaxID=241478 RepID=A0A183IKD1_9BILA|nr:unnamed protein product [Soboliphyme baturini]